MSIVKIVESCENCNRKHEFNRNKRHGICYYLSENNGDSTKITRFSVCRFYLTDVKKKKEQESLLRAG